MALSLVASRAVQIPIGWIAEVVRALQKETLIAFHHGPAQAALLTHHQQIDTALRRCQY